VPDIYDLPQNRPNPFYPTTEINYAIPKAGGVELMVFDSIGKVVYEL